MTGFTFNDFFENRSAQYISAEMLELVKPYLIAQERYLTCSIIPDVEATFEVVFDGFTIHTTYEPNYVSVRYELKGKLTSRSSDCWLIEGTATYTQKAESGRDSLKFTDWIKFAVPFSDVKFANKQLCEFIFLALKEAVI